MEFEMNFSRFVMGSLKAFVIFATLGFGGCVTSLTPVSNNTDITKVDFSKIESLKSGKSCAKWYFIFGPFGSSSVVDAVTNGKLSSVQLVDYGLERGFLTHSVCTIVYGR
jgi:hypothetical protein